MSKVLIAILICLMPSLTPAAGIVETAYYKLATDLSRDDAKEAYIRLDRAYEQFAVDFAFLKLKPRKEEKCRAVIFTDRNAYLRSGGTTWADGCYDYESKSLFVYFYGKTQWDTVVHEAFHQYAAERINEKLPTFFNEGTATYYGFSLFGGDSYLPGHISKYMVRIHREMHTQREMAPFDRLFNITQAEWNKLYRVELYHQAWSYMHYMLHSDAKNRRTFEQMWQAIADGKDLNQAWKANVGPDNRAFLEGWAKFWNQAAVENEDEWRQRQIALVTAAGVSRVNAAQGAQVKDLEAFFRASQAKQIRFKDTPESWLPPDLLLNAAAERDRNGKWTLTYDPRGRPVVTLQRRGLPTLQAGYDRFRNLDRTVLKVEAAR